MKVTMWLKFSVLFRWKIIMKTKMKTMIILFFNCLFYLLLFYLASENINSNNRCVLKSKYIINNHHLIENKSNKSFGNHKSSTEPRNTITRSSELKYILQWTPSKGVSFLGSAQEAFISRKCPYTNCYVSNNRTYFGENITNFDVIVFVNGPRLPRMIDSEFPAIRSPHQKYAFAAIESSDNYPVCSNRFDGYFNWTWTFRLDSEVKWGYLVIRDKNNEIVGPKKDMNWIKFEEMDPINDKLKEQLKSKTKAAAWFVSHCASRSHRKKVARNLHDALQKYGWSVDIYGKCGSFKCSRGDEARCFNLIKEKYYFYLSFENSLSEDYVTEKLLNAVHNDAIPIVYGAANYTRFLPEHSYLDARRLSVEELAAKMHYLINNIDKYYEYFQWKKYYSYHRTLDSIETNEYCLFCSTLNDKQLVEENKVYYNFREWWDPPNRC